MLLVHSLIPWSRFIPEKPEVPLCSSWNPQAKGVPSLEGRNTLRIPEKNPQENFWTLEGVPEDKARSFMICVLSAKWQVRYGNYMEE